MAKDEFVEGMIKAHISQAFGKLALTMQKQAELEPRVFNKVGLLRIKAALLETGDELLKEAKVCLDDLSRNSPEEKATPHAPLRGRIAISTRPETKGWLTRLRERKKELPDI